VVILDEERTVVSDLPPAGPDKPGFRDKYIRSRRSVHLTYRIIIGILGAAIILLGIALLPLPGPGWLIIFLGLGVLASEFDWARRLLDFARDKVLGWTDWVRRQSLTVRMLIGLGCLMIVVAVVGSYLWWQGVPSWIPWIG
jgi:uncharacterized protein (TIGR02611 family)